MHAHTRINFILNNETVIKTTSYQLRTIMYDIRNNNRYSRFKLGNVKPHGVNYFIYVTNKTTQIALPTLLWFPTHYIGLVKALLYKVSLFLCLHLNLFMMNRQFRTFDLILLPLPALQVQA